MGRRPRSGPGSSACCLLCSSRGGSVLFRDESGRGFVRRSDVGGSASGESGCVLQKAFFFKSLISLGPLQASSGSSDYQLLVLPGSLGLAGYQFWVPPACAAFGDIWYWLQRPCVLTSLLDANDSILLSPAGLGHFWWGCWEGGAPETGMEASCPSPPYLAGCISPIWLLLSYILS